MIQQSYDLNMIPGGVPIHVPVSQYDKGASRSLVFNLCSGEDGNGEIFTIPSGSRVVCVGTKPDRKSFSYDVTFQGNSVTVDIQDQMTCVCGDVLCEIRVLKDSEQLATANFVLEVKTSALQEGSNMSESMITDLLEIIDELNAYLAVSTSAITLASGWSASQNICEKTAGIVELNLAIIGGTLVAEIWNSIGTLPTGYRPASTIILSGVDSGTGDVLSIKIESSGAISAYVLPHAQVTINEETDAAGGTIVSVTTGSSSTSTNPNNPCIHATFIAA